MYLYLMRCPRLPFRTKIGITRYNPRLRASYIAESMNAPIIVVWFIKLWFAPFWEKTLHAIFAPLRTRAWGSGKTEWFYGVRLLCFVIYPLLWLFEWSMIIVPIITIFILTL